MNKLTTILRLMRPHQYVKNGFVWLPLFFGYKLLDAHAVMQTLFATIIFCLAASSVYIINDLKDIEEDRQHPVKKNRPLASGEISQSTALLCFVVILIVSCLLAFFLLPRLFLVVICGYILLNLIYSISLKHFAVIDIVCIAIGFLLRIYGGGIAAGVYISPWLVMMTFLIALFIALAKRRDDLILADNGLNTRKSLDGYSLEFVSSGIVIMASVIIVSYILYTVSAEIVEKHGTNQLYLTGFWVIIGLLRYLQITFVEEQSGAPTLVLLKDRFLQAVIVLWTLNVYYLLYINQ